MSKSNFASLEQALAQVRKLVDEDNAREALDVIAKFGANSAEMRNAYGVCLMRAGDLDKAIETYRGLCVGEGVNLRSDAPPVHLTNFATALLLKGNLTGCLDILHHLQGSPHPAAARLQAAIDRWRQSLTWWQRLGLSTGAYEPRKPVDLGFPPGDFS